MIEDFAPNGNDVPDEMSEESYNQHEELYDDDPPLQDEELRSEKV